MNPSSVPSAAGPQRLRVGTPIFAGRRLYNGLVVFDRRGRLAHTYAKCQLTETDRQSQQWYAKGSTP